jgi:hypothetical protein
MITPFEEWKLSATTLLAADEAFFTALLAADHDGLDRLLTDDFAIVDVMAGQLVPRDVFLGLISGGQLEFLQILRNADDISVRQRPGVGVIVGQTRMTMRFQGAEVTTSSRYTHVFIAASNGDRWRLLAAQGTPDSGPQPR